MCVFVCVWVFCFFLIPHHPPPRLPVSPSHFPCQSNFWGPPWSSSFPPLPSFSPSTPPSCYHLRLETSPEPFIPLLAVSLSTLSHHPAVPPIAPSLQLPTPRHPLPFGITPCVKWISPGEIYFLQDAPQRAKDARWPAQLRVALFFLILILYLVCLTCWGCVIVCLGNERGVRRVVNTVKSEANSWTSSQTVPSRSRRWVTVFTPRAQTAGGERVFRNPAISWRLD